MYMHQVSCTRPVLQRQLRSGTDQPFAPKPLLNPRLAARVRRLPAISSLWYSIFASR